MDKIWVVALKDIREAFRSRSTYFYVVLLCFLSVPFLSGLTQILNNLNRQGAGPSELQDVTQAYMNNAAFTLPLVLTMLICGILAAYSIIVEKARRILESLLATPLSLKQIWIGKSIAVTLPSILISIVVSSGALTVMNYVVIIPRLGHPVIPNLQSIVTGLVIVPLITFFIVAIVSFLQLVVINPRIANFAFTLIFLGVYMSSVLQQVLARDLSLIYFGVSVVLAIVTLVVSRFLSKEKVILTSKG
jgi:ABC-2 type transport system permease protein